MTLLVIGRIECYVILWFLSLMWQFLIFEWFFQCNCYNSMINYYICLIFEMSTDHFHFKTIGIHFFIKISIRRSSSPIRDDRGFCPPHGTVAKNNFSIITMSTQQLPPPLSLSEITILIQCKCEINTILVYSMSINTEDMIFGIAWHDFLLI